MPTIYDRLLLAKLEVTKGTDPVPVVGTNAVRIVSGKLSYTQESIKRAVVKQTMGSLAPLQGKRTLQLEIELDIKGSGAAGTAPEFGPLLQACGLAETIVAATSVAYDPVTLNHKSVTIYWYEDGLLLKLLGAVGKISIGAQIGAKVPLKLTFMAAYVAPTAVTCPTGAVYQSVAPLVMSSADIFNDGTVIKVGAFSLEDGNDVQHHYTTGQNEFVISNRQPKIKITKDSISTASEFSLLDAGTVASISGTFGATAGNRLIVTAPVATRESVVTGERAERNTREISYDLSETLGDDQFKLLFN